MAALPKITHQLLKRNKQLPNIVIDGYGPTLFQINQVLVHGSVFVTPKTILSWRPRTWEEVTVNSLRILELMTPRPEYFIIGAGDSSQIVDPTLVDYFKSLKVTVEVMQSFHAATTFTILNDEGRRVAAAILPIPDTSY